jgi:hypothetical protein
MCTNVIDLGKQPPKLICRDWKVRGIEYYMTWYELSTGEASVAPSEVQRGDLFLQQSSSSATKAWIWDDNGWEAVKAGHKHPLFLNYVLYFLPHGEPQWVTKKTLRTYKGRLRFAV